MSRFQKRTEEFAGQYMTSSKYTTTIAEDMSFSGDDPSKRNFRITFSQPSSNTPVPPAVAYVLVRVWFEGNKYVVKGYQVEGKKQLYEETFKFNEAWIDRIIAQVRFAEEWPCLVARNDEYECIGYSSGSLSFWVDDVDPSERLNQFRPEGVDSNWEVKEE